MSQKPPRVSQEIVDMVVAELDASLRADADVLSPQWPIFEDNDHEPTFKALCLTSRAFHRAAAPCLVRFIHFQDRAQSWQGTVSRLTSLVGLCVPKWGHKIEGAAICFNFDGVYTTSLVDHVMATALLAIPTLQTISLYWLDDTFQSYPKTCEALLEHRRTSTLVFDTASILLGWPLSQVFHRYARSLRLISLRTGTLSLAMWEQVLAIPTLESLEVDVNEFDVDIDMPAVRRLPTGLKYLQIWEFPEQEWRRILGYVYTKMEHVSIMVWHDVLRESNFLHAFPRAHRVDFNLSAASLAFGNDGTQVLDAVQRTVEIAGRRLIRLAVPEAAWIYAEMMGTLLDGKLPCLKTLCLVGPPRTLDKGEPWSRLEVDRNRALLEAFLRRRGIALLCGELDHTAKGGKEEEEGSDDSSGEETEGVEEDAIEDEQ